MVFLSLSPSRFLYERHEQSKQDLKGLEETVVSDLPSAPSQWRWGVGRGSFSVQPPTDFFCTLFLLPFCEVSLWYDQDTPFCKKMSDSLVWRD